MIRYLHFMPIDSPVFNGVLIDLINRHLDRATEEHLFLLGGEKNFRELKERYPNVRFLPHDRRHFIRAAEQGENLILHSLFLSFHDIRHIPTSIFRRVTWCVWGHDLYGFPKPRNLFDRYKNYRALRKIRKIKAIAVGFKYDKAEIEKVIGNRIPIYPALYSSGYYKEDIDAIVAAQPREEADKPLEIMIGHCAFPDFHHIRHLENLARFRDENIRIHLFLSYGIDSYRDEVTARARSLFEERKLRIVTEMYTWQEYIAQLSRMDIAILDFERQAAFGNIILLAYLRKKLYLSPTGVMSQALRTERIPVFDCNGLKNISFDDFCRTVPDYSLREFIVPLLDKSHIVSQWKQLFQKIGA